MILIDVLLSGPSGFIVAIDSAGREATRGTLWDGISTAAIVGQARVTADGCKAWLWPQAGTCPGRGRSVQAVTAETVSDLAAALRKRHEEKGRWWS